MDRSTQGSLRIALATDLLLWLAEGLVSCSQCCTCMSGWPGLSPHADTWDWIRPFIHLTVCTHYWPSQAERCLSPWQNHWENCSKPNSATAMKVGVGWYWRGSIQVYTTHCLSQLRGHREVMRAPGRLCFIRSFFPPSGHSIIFGVVLVYHQLSKEPACMQMDGQSKRQ